MMPAAHAIGGAEPLVDILDAPDSAVLGFVTRIEKSQYVGGGTVTFLFRCRSRGANSVETTSAEQLLKVLSVPE